MATFHVIMLLLVQHVLLFKRNLKLRSESKTYVLVDVLDLPQVRMEPSVHWLS